MQKQPQQPHAEWFVDPSQNQQPCVQLHFQYQKPYPEQWLNQCLRTCHHHHRWPELELEEVHGVQVEELGCVQQQDEGEGQIFLLSYGDPF
jgi:hypothetical protein